MFANILVPLDGSELGERALSLAQSLAKSSGATIHLLHSVSRRPELEATRGGSAIVSIQAIEVEMGLARQLIEMQQKQGGDYLERVAAKVRNAGIRVELAVTEGAAGDNIVDYARDHGIDLIVMSTRGHGGIKRLFVGSVTDGVIRSGHVPVLVVPPS